MAVHVFLTGFRGLIAPFIGFYLLGRTSIGVISWTSAAMILVASLALFPEFKRTRQVSSG